MYLLVNIETTLVFDYQLSDFCEDWYLLDMSNGWYWLLKISRANENLVIDALFNQPEKYLMEANKDKAAYKEASKLVKKCALGLIKPDYREISENFANALIYDYINQ